MTRTLDEKDEHILDVLRNNARTSVRDLARKVGLGTTPCRARVRRLEKLKYIAGYTIREGVQDGAVHSKFMVIELMNTQTQVLEEVEKYLRLHKAVSMICLIEGQYDYLIKVDEKQGDSIKTIFKDLRALNLVRQTNTFSVIEQLLPSESTSNL